MKLLSLSRVVLGLTSLIPIASSCPTPNGASLPLPYRILQEFPEPTWIENIAVRHNGALLLTILSPNASLYQLSHPASKRPCLSLVHTFDEVTSLLGIAETSPDVFAIVGANFSAEGNPVNGTTVTFSVDFNKHKPIVKTITSIPEASLPNGLTPLPHHPTTVLIADSVQGLIWRVDTLTGKYDVAMQTPEMAFPPGASTPIGINGIHFFQGDLYFDNGILSTMYRVKVTPTGSIAPHAAVETVAVLDAEFLDDFSFAADGTIYVETNKDNRVIAVRPDGEGGYGEGVVVEGEATSPLLAGDTASAFGRTKADREVLYVVTSGGAASPGEGGKVVAIDTTGF